MSEINYAKGPEWFWLRPSTTRWLGIDILVSRGAANESFLAVIRHNYEAIWYPETKLQALELGRGTSGVTSWVGWPLRSKDGGLVGQNSAPDQDWGFGGLIMPPREEGDYVVYTVRVPRVRAQPQSRAIPTMLSATWSILVDYGLYSIKTENELAQLFAFDHFLFASEGNANTILEVSAEAVARMTRLLVTPKAEGPYYGRVVGDAGRFMDQVTKRLGWHIPRSVSWPRVEIRDGGWLFLSGPACTYNPSGYDEKDPAPGYKMEGNNLDTAEQQAIILAGVASLWQDLRRMAP